MKVNWKLALLCLATLTMVACGDKNPAEYSDDDEGSDYESPIKINDHSIADWDALDPAKVAVSEITNDPLYTALKKIKVYADHVYINFILFYDPNEWKALSEEDFLHIYMNADNNDETGGYWDQFDAPNQGNTDLMFEGVVWDAEGTTFSYNLPTVNKWAGEPNDEGWKWEVLPTTGTVANTQIVEPGILEGRLTKKFIPFDKWTSAFEIGFDIQQNHESVGLLPQINTPDGEHIGRSRKLYVEFDMSQKK